MIENPNKTQILIIEKQYTEATKQNASSGLEEKQHENHSAIERLKLKYPSTIKFLD